MAAVIVELATHPQFLSNTYLVSDGEGGPAFFVDAGGPVAPLIEAAERLALLPTHVLLTHHHFDHVCEVGDLRSRWPELEVLISPLERELLAGALAGEEAQSAGLAAETIGTIEVGQTLEPHRLCTYLYALAQAFTDFYESCPVLRAESADVRAVRTLLCSLTADTLHQGLELLGLAAPDRL